MVFGSLNDCMHLADRNVRQRSYPDDRLSRITQLHSYAEQQGRDIDTQNMARKKCRAVIGRFTVTVRIRGIGDNGKLAVIVLLQRESSSGPGHESECSRGIAQQKARVFVRCADWNRHARSTGCKLRTPTPGYGNLSLHRVRK